jgi:hypothetical protein
MTFGKALGILVVLSLAATGSAIGRDISSNATVVKGNPATSVKGDKGAAKNGQAPLIARHAKPQAPIVMGRSVSVRHNTKLHHVKIKSPDLTDTPVSADGTF